MPVHEPAIFYPFRRHYSERARDLDALGMPPNLKRADQVVWLKAEGVEPWDIAWLLGIDRLTVDRYLREASPPPPHREVTRDRLWKHILPAQIARAQVFNERDRMMLRAHEAGATYREISARVGIWPQQVGMAIKKAKLRMARPTPVEEYFEDELADLRKLAVPPVAVTHCPTCGRPMQVPVK